MTHSEKSSTGVAAPAKAIVEIDEAFCKGCGLCIAFCERDVLDIATVPNRKGIYAAVVTAPEGCRGCCRCALVCPEAAIRIVKS
jgi:2-oxoglutarate ferredoxin oxidoreductase subunit delta